MELKKHMHVTAMVTVLLALIMVPTSVSANTVQRDYQNGGTLRHGIVDEPADALNPLLCSWSNYALYIYSSLIQWDEEGALVGDLAESWSVSADGLTLTYVLKEGLMFADGQPLTSADIEFSVHYTTEYATVWLNYYEGLYEASDETYSGNIVREGAIETPDERTVTFHLLEPSSTALVVFGGHYIMPKHIFDGHNIADPAKKQFFYDNAHVSSGVFKFKEYVPGSYLRLERNPYYHTPSYVDEYYIRFYADFTSAEIALINGEIDHLYGWSSQDWMMLSQYSQLELQLNPGWGIRFVWFNHDEKLADGTHNPVSDIRVREAIYRAIDIPAVLDATIGEGFYDLISEPQPTFVTVGGYSIHNEALDTPLFEFDPVIARDLLAKAGYAGGMTLKYILASGFPARLSMAQFFQSYLADVGITMEIETFESTAYMDQVAFVPHPMSWNMAFATTDCSPDAYVGPYYILHEEMVGVWNWGGWNNTEFSDLIDESFVEVDDKARAELYKKAHGIAADEITNIWLYNEKITVGYNEDFKGWRWVAHPMQGHGSGLYPISMTDVYHVPSQEQTTITATATQTETTIKTQVTTAVAEYSSMIVFALGLALFAPLAFIRRRMK